jgi:peptide/nickel transport system substrate-binding protein
VRLKHLTDTLAVATAVAVMLGVSACVDRGEESAPSSEPSTAPSARTNQINLLPRDKVQDGGTFTYPMDQMPPNFNYHELDGTILMNSYIIAALMPRPFTNDATAAPVWNRDYLASEPTLVTEPKQVVTYRINPKAAWYDGTPITWEDFHWQWKSNNGTDKRFRISSANGYEDIESVAKGTDEREVIVTFRQKYADWTAIFNPLYPASTNKDPKIFNEGWKERPLTTAGPFKLGSIDHTAKTITLVRNEKWWGNPAKLDRIVFRIIEADAQIDALANGEIDAMDIGPDANKYARAKAIANVEIRVAGGPNYRHITINGTSPTLQDVRVRRALAMAINRPAIAKALLGPLDVETKSLDNHIFMANQDGYQNNSGDVGRYDPEQAKQLLDEAGWKLDGSVRKKDGKPLEINLVIPSAVATSKQEAELVQNMLGQIGAQVKINTVPSTDLFDKYITPGQFDFTVFSWMGTAYPIGSSKSLYSKPTRNAKGELDVRQNYARVGSDEIDQLLAQANGELDRRKAMELANRADALIWQEVHSLTTYQRPELVASKKNLANFGAFGFTDPWVYEDIGWAKP